MEWFSLCLPLISQLVVPVSLVAWLAFQRHAKNPRFIAVAALVATYVFAIGIAGLWLVLPWWLPFAYGAAVVRRGGLSSVTLLNIASCSRTKNVRLEVT